MAEYDRSCPAKQTVNIGNWVRLHSEMFLHNVDPVTGEVVLNYNKATPVLMMVLLLALVVKTDDARKVIDSLEGSESTEALRADLEAWEGRLQRYMELNDAAVASTPDDPASIWWCVTMPLILGWYPDAACTGIDPEQKVQEMADVATPIRIINGAVCLGAFYDTQGIGRYFEYAGQEAEALAEKGIEEARALYDQAKAFAQKARDRIEDYLDFQKRALPWVAGAVIIGGLVYLSITYGPKRRK